MNISRIVAFHELYFTYRFTNAIKAIELVNIVSKEEMDLFALIG